MPARQSRSILSSMSSVSAIFLSFGLIACGNNAEAMAKKPAAVETHPPATVIIGGSEDYQKGYELGHRNGSLISQRLRAVTLGIEGCSGLPQYQKGLLSVAENVQPPRNTGLGKEISKGFFRGYLDSLRASIEDSRLGCSAQQFESGEFAGELYGSLLCGVARTSLDAYLELESTPLYANWAGGSVEVKEQCSVKAKLTLSECSVDLTDAQSTTELLLNVSCSD